MVRNWELEPGMMLKRMALLTAIVASLSATAVSLVTLAQLLAR